MPTYPRAPVEFVRGEAARLWDADGREYVDLFSGLSVHNAGNCHPRIVAAISEQLLSIHMIQHMLLMIVAAPLLAAASPILAVAWALPARWRIALARAWLRVRPRPRLSWQPVFA